MDKRRVFGKYFIYFVFVIWFGTEVLLSSTIEKVLFWDKRSLNDFSSVFILVLLMVQIIFFQKYSIKEIMMISILALPIIVSTIISGNNRMMSTLIFIVAAKNIDFDIIAKISYYVGIVMTGAVFYLFFNGYINEVSFYRGQLLRHSYGFEHPNQLGVRIFLLVVCRCYIRRKKFNFFDWLIIVGTAIFVNNVSNSKTSFYALIILAIITFLHILMIKVGIALNTFTNILILSALGCNILSLLFSFMPILRYPMLNQLDKLMSRRFSNCHITLKYYGVKLFGQNVQLIVNRPGVGKYYHFWLDNAYMSILLRYGPIVLILFTFMYIRTMVILGKMEQFMLIEIMCLYSIYGVMENNYFSMSQNLFLLLLSYPLYRENDAGIMDKVAHRRIRILI